MTRVEHPDTPLTEFEFRGGALRGAQLTLYPNRIVLQGGGAMETVPLAHLAAVRVAFGREPRKLNWAIALAVTALLLASIAGPLQSFASAAAAEVAEHARREASAGGVPRALIASFRALGGFASLLPAAAAALAAWAAALAAFYWLGRTTLTLSFGAVQRAYAVRGRDRLLHDFAESVGRKLAELAAGK